MLKQVIHYVDYDGKEREMTAYFNLNKTECVDINLEYEDEGGLAGHLKKLLAERIDGVIRQKPAIDFIKLIIDKAYGVRPKDDPTLFLKEDEEGRSLYKRFKQTAAYDAYVYALLAGEESLEAFVENVLPPMSDEQKAAAEKMMEEEGLSNLLSLPENI